MPKLYAQEMDSDVRRSWSGNPNHRIQNHAQELLSKIKPWKKEKQRSSMETDKLGKVSVSRLEPFYVFKSCIFKKRKVVSK